MKKLLALALILVLLPFSARADALTPYSEMEYTGAGLEPLYACLETIRTTAEGEDTEAVLDAVDAFYIEYDRFITDCCLADIRTSGDLTDAYWAAEYAACSSAVPEAQSLLDGLYTTLAASSARDALERDYFGEGFFEAYDGGSFYDDILLELMERENALVSDYYSLFGEYGDSGGLLTQYRMARILCNLIPVRRQIADYCGYDYYPDFADAYEHYRDYTGEELERLLEEICAELTPLYREYWSLSVEVTEADDSLDFLRSTTSRMGGRFADAFRLMEEAGLYDIESRPGKYDQSFLVYLPSYEEPFLFMNPEGTTFDYLNITHEFGHFCNEYASRGTLAGVDVAEIFSQGMEYMALCYGDCDSSFVKVKLSDSLCSFVEQACFAEFEREIYKLDKPTVGKLCSLYKKTVQKYGLDATDYNMLDFTLIPHFYTDPLYIPGYIVSNYAAMQMLTMELECPGEGLRCLSENLDSLQVDFRAFLADTGLESPFVPGSMKKMADLFRESFAA